MIALPQSTAYGKRIPKQKFYENLTNTPDLKRCFVEQIKTIIWRNKIAVATANIEQGKTVTELEVFEIQLAGQELNPGVMQLIDKQIPYHILFILTHEGKAQAWIGYKEAAQTGNNAFKVTAYYHTEWMDVERLTLRMEEYSTDAVYESFIRQIGGEQIADQDKPIAEAVALSERRKKLQREIAALQKKVDNEKQFNRRIELNARLLELKSCLGRGG